MAILLEKTLITKLTNCYIDSSYSKAGNTNIVNIEVPNPKGENVREPFTIRTKDGFALKYDENTGSVVYRFANRDYNYELLKSQVIAGYNTYFTEFTFNLQALSTYKNNDPVFEYIAPTYRKNNGDGSYQDVPLFEYSDIEDQKENIFILETSMVEYGSFTDYPIFLVSYYGKDPKRCKLGLFIEKFTSKWGEPTYTIKTKSGRMFSEISTNSKYGADEMGMDGTQITGLVSISANAEKVGEVIKEDTTDGLFTTYVVNQSDLKKIADEGSIYSEIIINTFSYPIKFDNDDLLETNIVLGNSPLQNNKAKRFKIAEPKIKIFSFNVPYLKDVESCKLLLPFNPEIILDYDIIRGKVINGYIQYEVSTNSSTLYIDNGDVEFYKDIIVIETVVPFKPTGEYKNFKETEKRLGKQVPTLLIKCLQEERQQHFIKGRIDYPIIGILKDELDLLNTELQKGVITNE